MSSEDTSALYTAGPQRYLPSLCVCDVYTPRCVRKVRLSPTYLYSLIALLLSFSLSLSLRSRRFQNQDVETLIKGTNKCALGLGNTQIIYIYIYIMFICMSSYLSIYLSVLSVLSLSLSLSIYPSIHPSISLSIDTYIYIYIYTYVSIHIISTH